MAHWCPASLIPSFVVALALGKGTLRLRQEWLLMDGGDAFPSPGYPSPFHGLHATLSILDGLSYALGAKTGPV